MKTSNPGKRSYHHGDLHAALLRSAGKILEKEGLEALSLREAARRAGVSHSAPYRHFAEREALLAALAAQGFEWLGAAQAKAAAAGLRAMGEAYVAFALAHPQRFRLMFSGHVSLARQAQLREVATRAFDEFAGALSERAPRDVDARDSSIAAWALVHGLAQLLLEERISGAAKRHRDDTAFVRDVLASARFAPGVAQRFAALPDQPPA